MPHLVCIVGARPNFMKMAPILRALEACPEVRTTLVHTGQHYDASLSQVFFNEIGMRAPDVSLSTASSSTHAVIEASVALGANELAVIPAQDRLLDPLQRLVPFSIPP